MLSEYDINHIYNDFLKNTNNIVPPKIKPVKTPLKSVKHYIRL